MWVSFGSFSNVFHNLHILHSSTITGVGSSVKELINKMSDCASTSLSNIGSNIGSNSVRKRKKKNTASTDKALASGTETPDAYFDGSGSFVQRPHTSNSSKASKLACDRSRSRSLMDTVSQHSILQKRTESEDVDTFYSCESEADEEDGDDDGQFTSRYDILCIEKICMKYVPTVWQISSEETRQKCF